MSNKIKQTQLANGLQILGEVNSGNKSAAIGFFVKTGARDETPKEAGISHFLEHMMFKGTAKRSALDITYAMGNVGAKSNAFTSEECTAYYAAAVTEYVPQIQEILSDMLRPALDQHEFDTEKNVILEEIALYLDRPQFYLFERANKDYFGNHPAGNSVLGGVESVSAIQRDEMQAYFERRYAPNNMVLVAAGAFDWDNLVADAEKYCGMWKPFDVKRECAPHHPQTLSLEYKKKDLTQAHLLLMTGSAAASDEERYPLSILSMILGDSVGSKFYWALIDSGLAETACCETDERDDVGTFNAYCSMAASDIDRVGAIAKNILEKPLDFSDDELQRAKTKLAAKTALGGELPMSRMNALGRAYLARKKVYSLAETIKKIRSVTRDDIEKAITKFGFGTWSEFKLTAE